MLEAQLSDAVLVFDGEVPELFQIAPERSSRYRGCFLSKIAVDVARPADVRCDFH